MPIVCPPPPFWRTPYHEASRSRPGRAAITYDDVAQVLAAPFRSEKQPDGRVRYWGRLARQGQSRGRGEDTDEGLVIHYGPDGLPHAFEIEHASERPDLVARALCSPRRQGLRGVSASTDCSGRCRGDARCRRLRPPRSSQGRAFPGGVRQAHRRSRRHGTNWEQRKRLPRAPPVLCSASSTVPPTLR